jgi:peptidoglycan/xylan/chitin deacetylase (PgdA/CDA1 family)
MLDGAQGNKNMKKIISRKSILKKSFPAVLIAAILGFGLFQFDVNKTFINNFQPYYLKSYVAAALFSLENLDPNNSLATASVAFMSGKDVTLNSSSTQKLSVSVPVLLYHGILNESDGANISLDNFKDQMFSLKRAGWQSLSINDFHEFMNGEKSIPNKSFLLTFDDGRKDSYYPVDEILRALEYRATIFIITDHSLGDEAKLKTNKFYLDKAEIKKMQESGRWDIQVHTKDGHDFIAVDESGNKGHYYSNKLWIADKSRLETDEEYETRIKTDFLGAKEDLEKNLGENAISFAFPFGDFGQESINFPESENVILKDIDSIYKMAFYQVWAGKGHRFNYPDKNTFLMKRIGVDSTWSGQDLIENLEKGREKGIPFQENFGQPNSWLQTWGSLNLKNNSMQVGSNASTTGSTIFLDGSYLWEDYIFNMKIDWIKGSNVSLLARHKDDMNYIACSFSDDKLRIEQYLKGKNRIMVEKKMFFEMSKKDVYLGIVVNKAKVECLVNGNSVIYSYYLSPALSHGGIGIKTWDPKLNNSEIVVKNVEATTVVGDSKDEIVQLPQTELALKTVPTKNTVQPAKSTTATTSSIVSVSAASNIKGLSFAELSFGSTKAINFSLATSSAWTVRDGVIDVATSSLFLKGIPGKSSGYFVLGGGYNLTGYKVLSSFDWRSGSSVSILARYADNKNYMECVFTRGSTGGRATLYSVENGQRIKLFDSSRLVLGGMAVTTETQIGMETKGKTVSCVFNDQVIITYTLERMKDKGTFGFKLWDKNIGSSVIYLNKLQLSRE